MGGGHAADVAQLQYVIAVMPLSNFHIARRQTEDGQITNCWKSFGGGINGQRMRMGNDI